jgi:hypothetical protein
MQRRQALAADDEQGRNVSLCAEISCNNHKYVAKAATTLESTGSVGSGVLLYAATAKPHAGASAAALYTSMTCWQFTPHL